MSQYPLTGARYPFRIDIFLYFTGSDFEDAMAFAGFFILVLDLLCLNLGFGGLKLRSGSMMDVFE